MVTGAMTDDGDDDATPHPVVKEEADDASARKLKKEPTRQAPNVA